MKQTSKTSKETEFAHGWETLKLIFRRPENDATRSVLLKHMEQILFGLHDFINRYVGITEKISLKELSDRFTDTIVKKNPEKKLEDVITDLIVDIAPHAVNVASPYFVGHMTSAIPFFMVHLKTIITALNQNVVAYKAYGIDRCVVLVSRLGHFSLRKAGGLLGIGNKNIIGWGGPILLSEKYKKLLKGIELADSVTIDGHKQFYMPMSCGMVYFKNPLVMDMIAYYASYVNRPGSLDLGIKSIAGSREATSLILDSTLKIMGRQGYALLIEHGIETAKIFAKEIERRKNFELLTPPELNILTYRICPFHIRQQLLKSDTDKEISINKRLNEINRTVQRLQREAGKSFVSRTTLMSSGKFKKNIVVFRCVIMNPLTGIEILKTILDEQENIFKRTFLD